MVTRRLIRMQEKGQFTLPVDVRKKLGLKKGDLVAVVETDDGVFITSPEVLATKTLDHIGKALDEQGLTLDELIESGREERGEIMREQYGVQSKDEPTPHLY